MRSAALHSVSYWRHGSRRDCATARLFNPRIRSATVPFVFCSLQLLLLHLQGLLTSAKIKVAFPKLTHGAHHICEPTYVLCSHCARLDSSSARSFSRKASACSCCLKNVEPLRATSRRTFPLSRRHVSAPLGGVLCASQFTLQTFPYAHTPQPKNCVKRWQQSSHPGLRVPGCCDMRQCRGKLNGLILERNHLRKLPAVLVSPQFLHKAPGPLALVHASRTKRMPRMFLYKRSPFKIEAYDFGFIGITSTETVFGSAE
jgi:hypothetical protein